MDIHENGAVRCLLAFSMDSTGSRCRCETANSLVNVHIYIRFVNNFPKIISLITSLAQRFNLLSNQLLNNVLKSDNTQSPMVSTWEFGN